MTVESLFCTVYRGVKQGNGHVDLLLGAEAGVKLNEL